MRFVSFDAGRGPQAGRLAGGEVAPITAPGEGDLGDLLLRGPLPASAPGVPVPLADVRLLPPIPRPAKIICIGLNYAAHAAEQGAELPEYPTVFAKFANALAPAGATVPLPSFSQKVDYEAEVAFVIGDTCKDVPEAEALDHVAGYTLLNDLSARDYQRISAQWMPGKVFDHAAPCGPALVTPDEAGPADAIGISLTLNGQEMQNSSTADLIHSVPALVAFLSKLMTLEPGDIVSTGTPSGVGMSRKPRVWLQPGDEVVVASPQLGELRTTLA